MSKLLREIDFGEPDANAEHMISLRSRKAPLYIRAWSPPEIKNFENYANGAKFIITGQKGTGKTAILRHMEASADKEGYATEFIVFKNEIIREAELLHVDHRNLNGSMIEEDELKSGKFYYHAIKRVMIALLISKLKTEHLSPEIKEEGFFKKLIGRDGKEALRLAFDSILNIAQSAETDTGKLTKGMIKIDPGQLLKKSNDDLLNQSVRLAKAEKSKIRLYFDEMHFAYRDRESLRSDATLVRDTILACQALNERFASEDIDIVIYIAIRKEFLDQPEIAQVDVVHVIESYGEAITWEHYPADAKHPIFDFIALRFAAAMSNKFTKKQLLNTYLKNVPPENLLEYTWSKPRDLVRFFKTAQNIEGNTVVISQDRYKIILRSYCEQAWREVKSALAAFIPTDSLPLLERGLKNLIPGQLDGSKEIRQEDLACAMQPAFDNALSAGIKYDMAGFCDILYMMGIIYYTYTDAKGKKIFQQYHRGNTNPTQTGEIRIHSAVAKALS
ncbi:hypothetical protein MXB02_08700 [Pseudomonas mosselii]|uniref:P-loop ATPase, Sll1717 family n=1 Tax=Pseudomonas mosselii TaxID=78327 RepID=UPI001FFAF664|nr:hypothetical protein [Pseudomonas mosselii]UPF05685.1 hypothetical protein MXB02_08700 [Pseudomonas mosselii]